jgi:COMPASS component SWD3
MVNYSKFPRDDDAVLGNAHFAPVGSLMLGGIEGLKQQFKNKAVEIRLQAIKNAVKYENKGVDLILEGLKDSSLEVCECAYLILRDYQNKNNLNQENLLKITQGLKQFIPFKFYKCCSTLKSGKKCVINNNAQAIAFFTGKKIRVFDLNSKELLYFIETNMGNRDFFQLSYNCDILIKVNNTLGHLVEIWEENTLKYKLHEYSTDINTIALSQDGLLLATATRDGTIKIWRVKTGKSFLSFRPNLTWGTHKGIINNLIFTDNGNTLISSSNDGTIKLWDLNTGGKPRTLKYYGNKVILSPDGLTLAVADLYGNIQLIDLSSGKLITVLNGHSSMVKAMTFSQYGRVLVTGGSDNLIKFWNMYSKTEINSLQGHTKAITDLVFTDDYQHLISVSDDNTVKKWGVLN